MGTIKRIEKRQRGFFGWLFLLLFWGFNLLMAFAFFSGISASGAERAQQVTSLERDMHAVGTFIGAGMLLTFWAIGAALLGLFVLLTRGAKVVIETSDT